MREIKTEIVIEAKQEAIWRVLTDFNSYPTWNPFFKHISGELKEGSTLKVTIAPPNVSD